MATGRAGGSVPSALDEAVIPSPSSRQGGGLRIEIKRYRAVAQWRWDLKDKRKAAEVNRFSLPIRQEETAEEEDDENNSYCGICRLAFDATCPDCSFPGEDCPPVLGACGHAFHMHCIMKWLEAPNQHGDERHQQCTLCRAPWQFQSD